MIIVDRSNERRLDCCPLCRAPRIWLRLFLIEESDRYGREFAAHACGAIWDVAQEERNNGKPTPTRVGHECLRRQVAYVDAVHALLP